MAQLVALMSGVVLGGVAEVVGSNLARGKIFTASIGSVDSVYIYISTSRPAKTSFQVDIEIYGDKMGQSGDRILSSHIQ